MAGPRTLNPILEQQVAALGGTIGDGMTSAWSFGYVADFTNIAQNANQIVAVKIDAGVDFILQSIQGSFWLNSNTTPTGAAANSLLYQLASSDIAELTSAGLHHVTVQCSQTDRQWFNREARANLILSRPGELQYAPTSTYVPASDTVQITVANKLPALTGAATPAIDGQIILWGMKISRTRQAAG